MKEMIVLHACPRCSGAVLEYPPPTTDSALCINCGWRRSQIPPAIQAQVEAHLGQPFMEERYTRERIGTGKPPLNGWDRVKRRRERESKRRSEGASAVGATQPELESNTAFAEGPSVAVR